MIFFIWASPAALFQEPNGRTHQPSGHSRGCRERELQPSWVGHHSEWRRFHLRTREKCRCWRLPPEELSGWAKDSGREEQRHGSQFQSSLQYGLVVNVIKRWKCKKNISSTFSSIYFNDLKRNKQLSKKKVLIKKPFNCNQNFTALLLYLLLNIPLTFCRLSTNQVWNKIFGEDGLIQFTTLSRHGQVQPFHRNSCPLVTLIYQIPDLLELRQITAARETQNRCQINHNANLQESRWICVHLHVIAFNSSDADKAEKPTLPQRDFSFSTKTKAYQQLV